MDTPTKLVRALDLMTEDAAPSAEALGASPALHYRRTRRIFDDPNIVGIGISEKVTEKKSTGDLSLCFYVEKKVAKRKLDPDELVPPVMAAPDGKAIFTDVKQIGRLRPQVNKRVAPIQSGFSVGHVDITAGTLGAIVRKGTRYFILSNAHVLALSGTAKKGAKILYPGPRDGGTDPKHLVAKLSEFTKFVLGEKFVNRADAALAEISKEHLDDLDFAIFGVKKSLGTTKAVRGMKVVKRGRTTGDTESTVQDVHFRFILEYDEVGKVGFIDQVLCERYTAGGDSGSIVADKSSGKIVGLHFAGAGGGSVFNPIDDVTKALKMRFVRK
jgi:hypothetical protein